MKILVTGCAGYIGSMLVGKLLKKQHKVMGVDNLLYQTGFALHGYFGDPNFIFKNMDVRDSYVKTLAQEADVVIPLAALVGAPICEKNPSEARTINYLAVKELVESLSPNQEVFFTNTNSGYGQTDGSTELVETDELNPISIYGKTKCEAEKVVLSHPRGTSFRLATVFGASPRTRLDLLVNDFTYKLKTKKKLQIFEPHFVRNYAGVQDVCNAILWGIFNYPLMKNKAWTHGAYNVGLPTANLTKMELAEKVCDVLGISKEAISIGDGKDPDQRNYRISNSKILSTGFSFAHSVENGIREISQVCDNLPDFDMRRMRNV